MNHTSLLAACCPGETAAAVYFGCVFGREEPVRLTGRRLGFAAAPQQPPGLRDHLDDQIRPAERPCVGGKDHRSPSPAAAGAGRSLRQGGL